MDNKEFESIFDGAVSTARALLVEKAKEYASDVDRLHNFKAAAGALNVTPELALRGMSTKHTISVNDMVKDPDKYTMAQWEEKLGDELNYIILLKALVWERLNDNADREVKADGEPLELLEPYTLFWLGRHYVAFSTFAKAQDHYADEGVLEEIRIHEINDGSIFVGDSYNARAYKLVRKEN